MGGYGCSVYGAGKLPGRTVDAPVRKPGWLRALRDYISIALNVGGALKHIDEAAKLINEARATMVAVGLANQNLATKNEELQGQITALEKQLEYFRVVDPNTKCPSCGHGSGKIRALVSDRKLVVQHTCNICSYQFVDAPVLENAIDLYQPTPAILRTFQDELNANGAKEE